MNKLYKFEWDCGRQGSVEGLFISTEDKVKELIGKEVYFGEILGKHSEIYGVIEEGEIVEVKLSKETISELYKVFGETISGYDPFNYIA